MGAAEPVAERENETDVRERGDAKKEDLEVNDLEKGEVGFEERVVYNNSNDNNGGVDDVHNDHEEFKLSRFNRLNPTNPLRIVLNNHVRVAAPSSVLSQRSHPRSKSIPLS